jgi:hypothetical protein
MIDGILNKGIKLILAFLADMPYRFLPVCKIRRTNRICQF